MWIPIITIIAILVIQYLSIQNNYRKSGIHTLPIFSSSKKILSTYFQYFRELNNTEKDEFIKRVKIVMKHKLFIAKEGFMISTPMKTLISGSLVQLTFGMKEFLLPDYKVIHVYPDAYLNHRTHKLYKGETNSLGHISLSWKHFIEGYLNNSDRLNVGLHEMAHALLNTILFSDLHDKSMNEKLLLLDQIPENERIKLFEGNHPFFRDYAQTNIKEFFAVAIESFFETPEEFNSQFPEFYLLMCNLLNQNPANKSFRTCGIF